MSALTWPATRRRGRALIYGDSASDSSVVDDMLRRAAAVAGDSEGSGMDISRRAAAWRRDVPGG